MPRGGPTDAVRSWLTSVRPDRRTLVRAGVNPIHGLHASFAGPIAGGLA
jgi:hypothetical protein